VPVERQPWAVQVPLGYQVGQWNVERGLASGSWSSVYSATRVAQDGGDDRPLRAALKFIPTGTLTSRQLRHLADMTNRELAVHRQVTHPRLVRVLDTAVIDDSANPALDGATVLAMELAVESAATALQRAGGQGLPDAPRLITEICAGLAHLHGAGWVHGDLKPGNVLIMEDGSVRLADFGLAAEIDGTHAYLPPGGSTDFVPPERWAEQVQAHGTAVRQTADVWALGVTACLLLTGQLPFSGVTARARAAAASTYSEGRARLTLPSGLPSGWRRFIADCLAPDHATRQRHDAGTLHRRALAIMAAPVEVDAEETEYRQDAPGTVQPPGTTGRGTTGRGTAGRGRPWWVAAAAALAVLLTSGTAAAVWQWSSWGRPGGAQEPKDAKYARHFRTDADIPRQYYDLIVNAGTLCPENTAVTPLLIAAMLKAESNFDPNLSDPANDEYGIARWTPSVLQYYLPAGQRTAVPVPPFPPEMSIPAVGVYRGSRRWRSARRPCDQPGRRVPHLDLTPRAGRSRTGRSS
jgi:serine/threonine protein kinase